MTPTLYMVVEHFKGGDAVPVYRRFRDRGRLTPDGLSYVSSWVDERLERCYQLMKTEDRALRRVSTRCATKRSTPILRMGTSTGYCSSANRLEKSRRNQERAIRSLRI